MFFLGGGGQIKPARGKLSAPGSAPPKKHPLPFLWGCLEGEPGGRCLAAALWNAKNEQVRMGRNSCLPLSAPLWRGVCRPRIQVGVCVVRGGWRRPSLSQSRRHRGGRERKQPEKEAADEILLSLSPSHAWLRTGRRTCQRAPRRLFKPSLSERTASRGTRLRNRGRDLRRDLASGIVIVGRAQWKEIKSIHARAQPPKTPLPTPPNCSSVSPFAPQCPTSSRAAFCPHY